MRPYSLFALLGGSAAVCAAWTLVPSSAICQDSRKTAKLSTEVQHCQTSKKDSPRMPCFKEGNSSGPMSHQRPVEPEPWQLARSPDPARGRKSYSITKIADANRSDHDVAGLMLRCGEGATTEVLVVLAEPLRSRTHPKVTVSAGATTTPFTASVVTPGDLVLLPEKASALVGHAWRSTAELAVAIADDHHSFRGVIPLTDISAAMQTLQSNCLK
jgi:hypothetical protein